MNRDYSDYINDLVTSIKDISTFIESMTYNVFIEDKKTVNAVIRSLEIIGEAAKSIPDDIKNKYINIPWKEMAGMRDKLIHQYFGVDLSIVWNVITEEIPSIEPELEKLKLSLKDNYNNLSE